MTISTLSPNANGPASSYTNASKCPAPCDRAFISSQYILTCEQCFENGLMLVHDSINRCGRKTATHAPQTNRRFNPEARHTDDRALTSSHFAQSGLVFALATGDNPFSSH